MSRTDAHVPLWVIETSTDWHQDFTEDHDHSAGPCDLDEYLAGRGRQWRGWRNTRCRRSFNGLRRVCSCHMCGQQPARKLGYRQERTHWRTVRAALLATVKEDRDTLDVPPYHPSAW